MKILLNYPGVSVSVLSAVLKLTGHVRTLKQCSKILSNSTMFGCTFLVVYRKPSIKTVM